MMKFPLICLVALLTACPTPPDPNTQNNGGNQATNQNNKGPANPNTQNNGNNNGSAGSNPNPPSGDGNGGGNQAQGGEQGGAQGGAQGENSATPPPAGGNPNQDEPPGTIDERPEKYIEVEEDLAKPKAGEEEGDGSAIGMYNDLVNANNVLQTQEEIKAGEYITISGKVQCNGDKCDSDLILRVTPFAAPNEINNPISEATSQPNTDLGIFAEKKVSNTESFSILAPKNNKKVVLELLLDKDKDGKANQGESFVIYEGGGGIELSKDREGIEFNFTPKDMKAPLLGTPNQK